MSLECYHSTFGDCVYAGAGTALMGKEAAMACTVAVEEVISEHYDKWALPLSIYSVFQYDANSELQRFSVW